LEPSKNFIEALKELFEETREQALLKNDFFLVIIDPQIRAIYKSHKQIKPLGKILKIPEEIEIKGANLLSIKDKFAILFFPDGTSSGGEIEIINHITGERNIIYIPILPILKKP